MTSHATAHVLVPALLVTCLAGCSSAPRNGQEALARSVAAQGGEKLTRWKTLTVKGSVKMFDGIMYNAAYLLYAKKPDKLKVERDMTADRGRRFDEYFLNHGVAWQRRSLLPGQADIKELERWMSQCDGVAYFADHASSATLKGEAIVDWKPNGAAYADVPPVEPRSAYVVEVQIGQEVTELFIDTETFYLLQEIQGDHRRVLTDFKRFEGVVFPTRVIEIAAAQRGVTVMPYVYQSVKYDDPIEDWIFTEDMPDVGEK